MNHQEYVSSYYKSSSRYPQNPHATPSSSSLFSSPSSLPLSSSHSSSRDGHGATLRKDYFQIKNSKTKLIDVSWLHHQEIRLQSQSNLVKEILTDMSPLPPPRLLSRPSSSSTSTPNFVPPKLAIYEPGNELDQLFQHQHRQRQRQRQKLGQELEQNPQDHHHHQQQQEGQRQRQKQRPGMDIGDEEQDDLLPSQIKLIEMRKHRQQEAILRYRKYCAFVTFLTNWKSQLRQRAYRLSCSRRSHLYFLKKSFHHFLQKMKKHSLQLLSNLSATHIFSYRRVERSFHQWKVMIHRSLSSTALLTSSHLTHFHHSSLWFKWKKNIRQRILSRRSSHLAWTHFYLHKTRHFLQKLFKQMIFSQRIQRISSQSYHHHLHLQDRKLTICIRKLYQDRFYHRLCHCRSVDHDQHTKLRKGYENLKRMISYQRYQQERMREMSECFPLLKTRRTRLTQTLQSWQGFIKKKSKYHNFQMKQSFFFYSKIQKRKYWKRWKQYSHTTFTRSSSQRILSRLRRRGAESRPFFFFWKEYQKKLSIRRNLFLHGMKYFNRNSLQKGFKIWLIFCSQKKSSPTHHRHCHHTLVHHPHVSRVIRQRIKMVLQEWLHSFRQRSFQRQQCRQRFKKGEMFSQQKFFRCWKVWFLLRRASHEKRGNSDKYHSNHQKHHREHHARTLQRRGWSVFCERSQEVHWMTDMARESERWHDQKVVALAFHFLKERTQIKRLSRQGIKHIKTYKQLLLQMKTLSEISPSSLSHALLVHHRSVLFHRESLKHRYLTLWSNEVDYGKDCLDRKKIGSRHHRRYHLRFSIIVWKEWKNTSLVHKLNPTQLLLTRYAKKRYLVKWRDHVSSKNQQREFCQRSVQYLRYLSLFRTFRRWILEGWSESRLERGRGEGRGRGRKGTKLEGKKFSFLKTKEIILKYLSWKQQRKVCQVMELLKKLRQQRKRKESGRINRIKTMLRDCVKRWVKKYGGNKGYKIWLERKTKSFLLIDQKKNRPAMVVSSFPRLVSYRHHLTTVAQHHHRHTRSHLYFKIWCHRHDSQHQHLHQHRHRHHISLLHKHFVDFRQNIQHSWLRHTFSHRPQIQQILQMLSKTKIKKYFKFWNQKHFKRKQLQQLYFSLISKRNLEISRKIFGFFREYSRHCQEILLQGENYYSHKILQFQWKRWMNIMREKTISSQALVINYSVYHHQIASLRYQFLRWSQWKNKKCQQKYSRKKLIQRKTYLFAFHIFQRRVLAIHQSSRLWKKMCVDYHRNHLCQKALILWKRFSEKGYFVKQDLSQKTAEKYFLVFQKIKGFSVLKLNQRSKQQLRKSDEVFLTKVLTSALLRWKQAISTKHISSPSRGSFGRSPGSDKTSNQISSHQVQRIIKHLSIARDPFLSTYTQHQPSQTSIRHLVQFFSHSPVSQVHHQIQGIHYHTLRLLHKPFHHWSQKILHKKTTQASCRHIISKKISKQKQKHFDRWHQRHITHTTLLQIRATQTLHTQTHMIKFLYRQGWNSLQRHQQLSQAKRKIHFQIMKKYFHKFLKIFKIRSLSRQFLQLTFQKMNRGLLDLLTSYWNEWKTDTSIERKVFSYLQNKNRIKLFLLLSHWHQHTIWQQTEKHILATSVDTSINWFFQHFIRKKFENWRKVCQFRSHLFHREHFFIQKKFQKLKLSKYFEKFRSVKRFTSARLVYETKRQQNEKIGEQYYQRSLISYGFQYLKYHQQKMKILRKSKNYLQKQFLKQSLRKSFQKLRKYRKYCRLVQKANVYYFHYYYQRQTTQLLRRWYRHTCRRWCVRRWCVLLDQRWVHWARRRGFGKLRWFAGRCLRKKREGRRRGDRPQ
jgi:hypothetical protein